MGDSMTKLKWAGRKSFEDKETIISQDNNRMSVCAELQGINSEKWEGNKQQQQKKDKRKMIETYKKIMN